LRKMIIDAERDTWEGEDLNRERMCMEFTGKKIEFMGGWRRLVKIGEQEYSCVVEMGRRVRIPYKPRGTYGHEWHGAVYRVGSNQGRVWCGDVHGSIGCKGLLKAAGVI
jgi:hypothetical protein